MGGAPYSSKGCLTCRRRKIKCGLQIPECAQCMKRGVECGGYAASRIFISYDQKTMQMQYVGRSRSATPKNLNDINSSPEIRDQLFATYMGAYFPATSNGDSQIDSWRYLISNFHLLPQKTPMLQRALCAISCVYVGRINDDERLSHHGIQLYNSSMRSMSKMLCTRTHSEDSLYATTIFQMIEKCIAVKKNTDPSGIYHCANGFDPWVFHMQAMNSLLRENQHKIKTNPLMASIYHSHAKLAVIYGILAVSGSGEENAYLLNEGINTPLDEIFEIFLTGRNLLDAIEMISILPHSDPRASPKACLALLQNLVEYRDRLAAWYGERETIIGGSPVVCEDKDYKNFNKTLLEDSPFDRSYRFSSIDSARIHVLYWAAMGFAHTLVYRAQLILVSANRMAFSFDQFPTDPSNYEAFVLAGHYIDQVCRSIPYCMQPMHRIWGTHVVFGTIGLVFKTYIQSQSRDKFLWCQKVLRVAGGLGLEMAVYFNGVADREWAAFEDGGDSLSRSPSFADSPDIPYSLDGPGVGDSPLFGLIDSPGDYEHMEDYMQPLEMQDITKPVEDGLFLTLQLD